MRYHSVLWSQTTCSDNTCRAVEERLQDDVWSRLFQRCTSEGGCLVCGTEIDHGPNQQHCVSIHYPQLAQNYIADALRFFL